MKYPELPKLPLKYKLAMAGLIILKFLFIAIIIYCIALLLESPELIGEFFGRIVAGYNSAVD